MRLLRRRRRAALLLAGSVLIVAVVAVQVLRSRVASYEAGEQPEGLIDTLARELPATPPDVRFTEVAAAAGLEFRHFPGRRSGRLPEDMGSGVALGDVDGDGWCDAFLVGSCALDAPAEQGRARLFRNLGDGRFEDVTADCGVVLDGQGMAAAFLDADSDGDLDLVATASGRVRLFVNDGAGRFEDATAPAGLSELRGLWTGLGVADHDRDGDLDVYVCGYVVYDEERATRKGGGSQYGLVIPALLNPSSFAPERNLLLVNDGRGRFVERAAQAGVAGAEGRSLGVLFCDLDDDGWPDLYVANDVSDNALYLNTGDGGFEDYTTRALVGDYRGAMGMAAGDFDGDLDLDLFITHWVAQENALYARYQVERPLDGTRPAPVYVDEADRYGLGSVALRLVGWATRFFDYDNDGLLDLFVVNGSTIPTEEDQALLEPMRSQIFWRCPGQRGFYDLGAAAGDFFAEEHVGRGGASWDYDLDGDEDLLVVLHGEGAALLRNDGGDARSALRVRLRQPTGNRFAVGARLVLQVGERRALELLGSQGSYLSQHAVGEVAFGLGTAARADALEVTWPDGTKERAGPFPARSLVTWTRGSAPEVVPFPGRRERDLAGPVAVADQREFFARRERAQAARLAGEPARAVELYLEALALWPGHADCLYYLGNCAVEAGDEAGALAAFERLVHYSDASSGGWMQLGLLRLPGGDPALDDLDAAERAFRRCHELNGESSWPVIQLGVVALLRGDAKEAEARFRDAAVLDPRSVEARWLAGRAAWERGDRAAAQAALDEARAVARGAQGQRSASNEGDTASGAAMTAARGIPLAAELSRWRGLLEREGDAAAEYADPD